MTFKARAQELDKLRQTHQIDNPEYFNCLDDAFKDEVLALIGEDEDWVPTSGPPYNDHIYIRNQLRQAIREKLEKE